MKRTTFLAALLATFALAAPLTSCTNDDEGQETVETHTVAKQEVAYTISIAPGTASKPSISDLADVTLHLVDNSGAEKTTTLKNGKGTLSITLTTFPQNVRVYSSATLKDGVTIDPNASYLTDIEVECRVITSYKEGYTKGYLDSNTFSNTYKAEIVRDYIEKWTERFRSTLEFDENGVFKNPTPVGED